ncbi:hypothetical protein GQ42DRAFT_181404 [Ramicandelaber brevisporus]|nr:hypothetical protein GQ42DRAFT_181404 [Ramicandelaber brevisporus]
MKFAIAFVAALASLATLNNAQETVGDVTCTSATFQLSLDPGLTQTAQDTDVEFIGMSSSCTLSGSSSDSATAKYGTTVTIDGKSSGSCGSGSASGDAKSTGFSSFSGTANIEVQELVDGIPKGEPLIIFNGPVNGKLTTGGIELESKIEEGKGKGKIIRIRSKGTSEDEKKKEEKDCKSTDGYDWIEGNLDTISITDK